MQVRPRAYLFDLAVAGGVLIRRIALGIDSPVITRIVQGIGFAVIAQESNQIIFHLPLGFAAGVEFREVQCLFRIPHTVEEQFEIIRSTVDVFPLVTDDGVDRRTQLFNWAKTFFLSSEPDTISPRFTPSHLIDVTSTSAASRIVGAISTRLTGLLQRRPPSKSPGMDASSGTRIAES